MLHYPVEQQLTDHVSYVHLILGMKLLSQAMNKYIKTGDTFSIRQNYCIAIFHKHVGQIRELRLSFYLFLLSIDSKIR